MCHIDVGVEGFGRAVEGSFIRRLQPSCHSPWHHTPHHHASAYYVPCVNIYSVVEHNGAAAVATV